MIYYTTLYYTITLLYYTILYYTILYDPRGAPCVPAVGPLRASALGARPVDVRFRHDWLDNITK